MSVDVDKVIKELKENEITHCSKKIGDTMCRMVPIPGMKAESRIAVKGTVCGFKEFWDADALDEHIKFIINAKLKHAKIIAEAAENEKLNPKDFVKKEIEEKRKLGKEVETDAEKRRKLHELFK